VEHVVEARDLVKRYRGADRPVVDGLSFTVRPGEVFGLLGPNGAGKTTTVGVLTTRVAPTSGSVLVDGLNVVADPSRVRQRIAVVPQRTNLDGRLTVRQNLLFHAAYHGYGRAERTRRAEELLERLGLTGHGSARPDALSGGQVQRVMIARALMHRPTVMFLDEPTNALDPQARRFVHELVGGLREQDVTVVLTTHDMVEEKLCDQVGIVDHGRLLASGAPARLTGQLPGRTTVSVTVVLHGVRPDEVGDTLAGIDTIMRVEPIDVPLPETERRFRLYTESESATATHAALSALSALGCVGRDLALGRPSLEDVFIHLTGRELR
jgi:ABC-2 type transport system ATP-binding protein